ncbi:MAG: hypothetical protein AAF619_11525 [Pseudomonadota bacterium]
MAQFFRAIDDFWRGGQDHLNGGYSPGNQRRIGQVCDPDRDVEPVFEGVDEAIIELELDRDGGIFLEVFGDCRTEMECPEGHGRVDLENATRVAGLIDDFVFGSRNVVERGLDASIVDEPRLGRRDIARISGQKLRF